MQVQTTKRLSLHIYWNGQIRDSDNTKCRHTAYLHVFADRNGWGYNQPGKKVGSFLKTKHTITIWPGDCIPRHLSQRNKNLRSYKNLCMNVYNSFSHNCQKPETAQIAFTGWMFRSAMVYPCHGISGSHKKEPTTRTWNDLNQCPENCAEWGQKMLIPKVK